ncbi:MAG: hypothetical protein HN891_10305 [Planctomycetes bacterium]|jgi:hypothetical protein|nr:hypothetical protein [Planctomycetota bacterium]MBT6452980.1 hypothetical protein [Planctomycetota bacterium]MBT6541819.1 hypothetical protein [Planctomycetota bacterium]MBT6784569.1 hypothetical protein [Planctomycetota bacterium]MBT6968216.1 hypothetical protein [Planctomycetota bacterium]
MAIANHRGRIGVALWILFVILSARSASAQAPTLEMGEVVVYPGQAAAEVAITLTAVEAVSGVQVGIAVDPDRIVLQELNFDGSVMQAVTVEFLDSSVDLEEGEATLVAIFDDTAPFDQSLPSPDHLLLATLVLDAASWLVPSNIEPIAFSDGVGEPALDNLVLVDGIGVIPERIDGSLSVLSQNVLLATSSSGQVSAGEIDFEVSLRGYNVDALQGFSSVLAFDPTILQCASSTIEGTITQVAGAEFIEGVIDNTIGFVVLGVLMDILPPYDGQVIPATGIELEYARIYFDVSSSLTTSSQTELHFENDLGTPPISNVFVIENQSVEPVTVDLTIDVVVEGIFLRGDADGNLRLDLADAINNLVFMTSACPDCPIPLCPKALDVNDNGMIDLGDAIQLLNFLYIGGSPPAAPFPDPGVDPTPDGLDCFN